MLKRTVWSLVLLIVAGNSVTAQSTVYTTSATFLPHVLAGFYTETFTGGDGTYNSPLAFSLNGFSYTVSAAGGASPLFRSGDYLGNTFTNQSLTFTMTSGNVRAIGGNFSITDVDGTPVAAQITIGLSDGTIANFTTSTAGDDYRGFVSPGPVITSLVISAPGAGNFNAVDNLTVGAAVPEPTSIALMGLSIVGLAGYWYRARQVKAARLAADVHEPEIDIS